MEDAAASQPVAIIYSLDSTAYWNIQRGIKCDDQGMTGTAAATRFFRRGVGSDAPLGENSFRYGDYGEYFQLFASDIKIVGLDKKGRVIPYSHQRDEDSTSDVILRTLAARFGRESAEADLLARCLKPVLNVDLALELRAAAEIVLSVKGKLIRIISSAENADKVIDYQPVRPISVAPVAKPAGAALAA